MTIRANRPGQRWVMVVMEFPPKNILNRGDSRALTFLFSASRADCRDAPVGRLPYRSEASSSAFGNPRRRPTGPSLQIFSQVLCLGRELLVGCYAPEFHLLSFKAFEYGFDRFCADV